MTLRPFVPIVSDETLASWAARLAAVHGGETLIPFLTDIGIPPAEMLKGSHFAVTRLADVTGADPDDLRRQTIRTIEWRKHELRGERFEPEFLKGSLISFCPACLLDDDSAGPWLNYRRSRLMWRLRAVRTCAVHGCLLVTRRNTNWSDRFYQMALVVPETGRALSALAEDIARREVSALQKYITDRLEGVPGPEWLDGQNIEQVVRTTEMLGVGLAFGRRPDLIGMSSGDWDHAGQVGFEFTKRGEEGVRAALDEMQRRAWFQEKVPAHSGPQMIFGPLYSWLRFSTSAKDSGPIRQILRQHIIETMPIASGTVLLGEVVRKARVHSVRSLSRQSGVHPKTLRNALTLAGLLPESEGKPEFQTFDAAAGEAVVNQIREAIPQTQLPAYMNATRGQVITLMQSGILAKIVDGGSGTKLAAAVSKTKVDAFLASIARDAQEVADLPALVLPINEATQKARVTTDQVIKLLQRGALGRVYRREGEQGYLAIHVDPEEVKGHFVRDPETMPLGSSAIAKALGTSQPVVNKLVAAGFIPNVDPNGAAEALLSVRVLPEALRSFQETYVSLMQLGREIGVHYRALNNALRRLGVKPVSDPSLLGITLFRRADIPPAVYEGLS